MQNGSLRSSTSVTIADFGRKKLQELDECLCSTEEHAEAGKTGAAFDRHEKKNEMEAPNKWGLFMKERCM